MKTMEEKGADENKCAGILIYVEEVWRNYL